MRSPLPAPAVIVDRRPAPISPAAAAKGLSEGGSGLQPSLLPRRSPVATWPPRWPGLLRQSAGRRASTAAGLLLHTSLVLLIVGSLPASRAQQPRWEPVEPRPSERTPGSLQPDGLSAHRQPVWEPVPASAAVAPDLTAGSAAAAPLPSAAPLWQPVSPAGTDTTAVEPSAPAPATELALLPRSSGATFANFRTLWRDGIWQPQISNTVPVGFGPQGPMLSLAIRAVDCKSDYCAPVNSFQQWADVFRAQGSGFFWQTFGFGDAQRSLGVVISNSTEGFAGSLVNGNNNSLLRGNNTGIHLSRSLGPDTAVRIGIENLILWDEAIYTDNRNAYGVISQRIRLNDKPGAMFQNLYLTAGAGNGEFRPLDEQVRAQIEAQKRAGCSTFGSTPETDCTSGERFRAVKRAGDYGRFYPIGSAALEVFNGFNLIAEWTGRNLNAGFSFRPFEDLGLVITPMFESLVVNCDYGCDINVPGYSESVPIPRNGLTGRARFSIQAGLDLKF